MSFFICIRYVFLMLGCGTKLCVFICIRHEFFIFYFLCWVVKLNCVLCMTKMVVELHCVFFI